MQAVSELSVSVPWGHFRGKVWGPDHGCPVLCLHGWADNCGSFNTLIPLLPKECRYVTLDLAGHGRSSHRPPGSFYSSLEYVADVRRVADALHLRRFSLIGHSMGADVAAMFSALYPEMVDAVILLDSYGILPKDTKEISKVMRQAMDKMIQFEKKTDAKKKVYTYEAAVQRLLTATPTLSEQSARILLERGLVQVEGGFMFSRDLRVNLKNTLCLSLEQSLEMQSRIQAPVLVILAEEGFNKIFPEPETFTSAILRSFRDKNHKVVTVPGDHHIHLNKPEVVATFVSEFLWAKVLSLSTHHKL
ncbi:serine hydrolase-like protein isoform X2 [Echeneis naucrates]|uniref:serine hydrolase-like protein isoform X2 n=1 Tax=Echeneis naucrates TaxID=173247 RepID=UPI0011140723|nr:serine hydrolase-like protein isoform X2 [Echeneis naucrates]